MWWEISKNSMNPVGHKLTIQELEEKLISNSGRNIQLWNYTASHCMLEFRVFGNDEPEIFILLNFVDKIDCKTHAKIMNPTVSKKSDRLNMIQDQDLMVVFEECYFSRNSMKMP